MYAESGGIEMEFKKALLATSAALAMTAGSSAQAADNYFTVFGGASFNDDVRASVTGTRTDSAITAPFSLGYRHYTYFFGFDLTAETDMGFVLGAAYGWDWVPAWRTELELAYREHQVEGSARGESYYRVFAYGSVVKSFIHLTGSTKVPVKTATSGTKVGPVTKAVTVPVDGSTSFFSVMANVWYDFNIAGDWETFIGGGVGFAQANVNDFEVRSGTKSFDVADGTDLVVAYQFGLGAGYNLDNGIRLSAQYRFFGTEETEIDGVELRGEANEFLFGISFPLGN